MKNLPIGIQTFRDIIEGDYCYVDKTSFIEKLNKGKYYFLSRPRRFGKSLFIDTLKEAFSGNKELFKGLYIYDKWDWDRRYPVIKISFGSGGFRTPEDLKITLEERLLSIKSQYKIDLTYPSVEGRFKEAIEKLYERYNEKVVVLIDEYDKPILDVIENVEVAKENREILKGFYGVLKDADPYLKLAFLTGVTRFSKVSIFSGLNQLNDITLDSEFSTICGYTQTDLETVFVDRLKDFDVEEVKRWYKGYSWLGENVYNPFDILLLFDKKVFRMYWFETGTPTFLIKLFKDNNYYLPDLENLVVGEEILSNLDIDNIFPENLLFQSGYLTIKGVITDESGTSYVLTYPNFEVRKSFNSAFLMYLTPPTSSKYRALADLGDVIKKGEVGKLETVLHSFFAGIPNDWYRNNDIDRYEGYYASVLYALFNGAGFNVLAEDMTNRGRIDMTVSFRDKAYIIEFKVVEDEAEKKALEQIREKRYYEKYIGRYKEIYLVGIEFSKSMRNIVWFGLESINII